MSKKQQAALSVGGSILLGVVVGLLPYHDPQAASVWQGCCPVIPMGDLINQPVHKPFAKAHRRAKPENRTQSELLACVPPPPSQAGFRSVGFEQLCKFAYPIKPNGTRGTLANGDTPCIPQDVKELDGEKVCLSGFLIPMTYEAKGRAFLLTKNQMLCCYGQTPKVNEWAIVTMKEPVPAVLDKPVVISGQLRVGEVKEKDVVLSLYRLEGEQLRAFEP